MTDTLIPAGTFDGAVPLTHWGLVRARGEDAASFLHGQLTQDIQSLDAASARLAGYCSAKGRLLASFITWRPAPDEVLLACSADVLAASLKRLSMFVLRAKCKLSEATDLRLYGLAGPSAAAWLGDAAPQQPWQRVRHGEADVIRLPDADGIPRWLLAAAAEAPAPALPALSQEAWRWLEVRSALPRVVGPTVEQFVPQMVNLELVGGVNFKKGCYPGQEVVARSQYRGTLKRRAFLFDAEADAAPGQEVFAAGDDPTQPSGMVVDAASLQGRHAALVELKIAALQAPSLHLRSPDGPALRQAPLPYDLPLDAA
ncbi:CAF17-like 4Fe-4S cluster assembly/insertion protein YgfZ [Azohydromonas caseinilytica]|uniref:Folate-binding protein YgfZ n=1 Tax=Azohydromonas caseinilytica TaxID=2728836 RepID=A0A848FDM0_9BURK|nr:folate-binding protein YgfZ [Azohydromonas caseinilytica]NML17402.1 folate-binding protein YgfZ [Azohydromonas caseinilytica]